MRWTALLLPFLLVLGCPKPSDDDGDTDTQETDDTDTVDTDTDTDVVDSDTDVVDSDTDVVDTDETDGPVPTDCKSAGGVCSGTADMCSPGRVIPRFAGDCVFDDGPGVCCKPPNARPTGTSCPSYGGACAPIAGCNFVDGWFAPPNSCGRDYGPGFVCCVPEETCGPHEDVCCGDTVSYNAVCDRTGLSCDLFPDTTLIPEDECILP